MIEMEGAERKRSRKGFLNLFDWTGKSRKKLFSSNTSSELSVASKQEKQTAQNPLKSWPSSAEGDKIGKSSSYNLRSDSSCSTSTSDDGTGSRAPSVVAKLMGLQSLPVPNASEPRFISDIDPCFGRSSRNASTFDAYESLGHVNLHSDYDGISWDHMDSRMNKECNQPIDRFQTETLPPRSAKPIPVTHNRLLSPIRSPGFVQSRDPAYVMEAASRIIDPSPRIVARTRFLSSDSSSSLPMRIRDLKERLEASQNVPIPQISNGTRNNKCFREKQNEKRTSSSSLKTQDTNKLLGEKRSGGFKGKVKPPSVSAHTKANTVHKRDSSTPLSGNRDQKKKNRIVKNGLKDFSASTEKTVVKPNNQKQNQFAETSVSNHRGSIVMNKVLVERGTTTKKPGIKATSVEKNISSSLPRKKILPRNKNLLHVQEAGIKNDKRIKKDEKLMKCNITVNGGFKTGDDDQKKDMDVVSFTFSSPIKGLSSDSRSSTKKTDQDTESALSFSNIDCDSLSSLLEKKLRELSSKLESSCSSLTQEEESSGSTTKEWVNGTISLPSDDHENGLSQAEEDQEVNSFSTDKNLQISSSKSFSNSYNETVETETSESVALSEAEEGHDWELEYITEIIASGQLMIKEVSLGIATDILPPSLYDELESKGVPRDNIERKTLFDFVNQCLTFKCEKMFMGSCRGLLKKEHIFLERGVGILAEEVKKEIQVLKKMREMMMDELVDNDMSSIEGKWLDYKRETYEEGVEIQEEIVSDLVDDLVNDLLLFF